MVADLYQTNDMHKVQRVNMLLLHSMICKSKQINISTIAKTALSKGIVGESQLSIHPLAHRMLYFSVLWMLKYNIDDNLVGQLTIIHPPILLNCIMNKVRVIQYANLWKYNILAGTGV